MAKDVSSFCTCALPTLGNSIRAKKDSIRAKIVSNTRPAKYDGSSPSSPEFARQTTGRDSDLPQNANLLIPFTHHCLSDPRDAVRLGNEPTDLMLVLLFQSLLRVATPESENH